MRQHTTTDGYVITAYSSLYLDWGLTISKDGAELFDNPHCLSAEVYGSSPPEGMTWDDAMDAGVEFVPWTDATWASYLANEADDLLEAFLPLEHLAAAFPLDGA